jgi:hypothetical protein
MVGRSTTMKNSPAITTKPGRKPGELTLQLPPAWDFRLRRVMLSLLEDTLPDVHTPGLSEHQREARRRVRSRRMQQAIGRFVSEVLTAEIIGKEIALGTRTRYGSRRGSLREHVQAILREVSGG